VASTTAHSVAHARQRGVHPAGDRWPALGALTLGAPLADSASTSVIAYQGRLADANGVPITQTVSMIFRLYSAASGGVFLWEEQWTGSNSVQVSDGLFNVMLGSLTLIPQSVVTGNSHLFLGITVGADDEMAPRVQLGSVPFAMAIPDSSITTAKIAEGAVTNSKQTLTSYYLDDNTYVEALTNEANKTLSQFSLQQVPAGDVVFYCSFAARADVAEDWGGVILLETIPGGDLAKMPAQLFGTHWDNYVVHGRLPNFAGGDLTVRIRFSGEGGDINVYFGAANSDDRFGRKCTIIAGL
jgi:hypothetical protein